MAFCAKCGTPLNDAGVCPNCGYVLPQSRQTVQAANTAGAINMPDNSGNQQGGENSSQPMGNPAPANIEATVTLSQAMENQAGNPSDNQSYGMGGQNRPFNGQPNPGPQGQPFYGQSNPGGLQGQFFNGQPNMGGPQGQPFYGQPNAGGPQGQTFNGQPNPGPQGQPFYGQPGGGSFQGYTGPQGGFQGQPYYGQAQPRKTSEFGNNLLQWFLGIFKKDPAAIFDKIDGSKSPVWAVYMAIYAFFGALSLACSAGSFLSIFGQFDGLESVERFYDEATFRCILLTFIAAFLFYVAVMFLTALAVWLMLIIAGKKVPFFCACNIMVVAYIPSIIASVFSFICSFTIFTGILALLVSSIASIATMILLYCAIERISGNKRPVLWIYVAAQAVLKILIAIIAVIFIFVFIFMLSALLMNSLNTYRYW